MKLVGRHLPWSAYNNIIIKMNIEKFITAVEERTCLWKLPEKGGCDKKLKYNMWCEVGQICFETWHDLSSEEKEEKVTFLQKKWKAIRDYYIRERRISGSAGFKKKKYSYFSFLHFLDNKKEPRNTLSSTNISEASDCLDETIYVDIDNVLNYNEEPSTSTKNNFRGQEKKKMTDFKTDLFKIINNSNDDDPNKHFLLSLLPEMATMTAKQNFSFRMEIMKALERIQYNDDHL